MFAESSPTNPAAAPIIILGAGANIGLSLARRLIAERRPVILSYRRQPEAAVTLQAEHPDLVRGAFALDARTSSAMERFFEHVRSVTDSAYALINCIGPIVEAPLSEMSDDNFENMVQGNLTQAFHAIRRVLPLLRANGEGRIIHFTFAGVEKLAAYRRVAAYAAAKTALLSLTRSLAVELASERITVNAVAPGVIITESKGEEALRPRPSLRATRVPTTHDDLYAAVRYLLSPEAGRVTGTNITVSGGFGLGNV